MHISHFQIRYEADVLERAHPDELFHVIGYIISCILSRWDPHVPDFVSRGFSHEGFPLVGSLLGQASRVRTLEPFILTHNHEYFFMNNFM
jgi:hypothetical protein